jgi:hypothetical protein
MHHPATRAGFRSAALLAGLLLVAGGTAGGTLAAGEAEGGDVLPPLVRLLLPGNALVAPPVPDIDVDIEAKPPPPGSPSPLSAVPFAPARPAAWILHWDHYRTLVVIDASAGRVKPAWVATMTTVAERIPTRDGDVVLSKDQVLVSYRATAFRDRSGVLHIDSRHAFKSGPMAENWVPDSFAIGTDRLVVAQDDNPDHPPNAGEVEREVDAESDPTEYRRLLFTAQGLVQGNL